MMKVLVIVVTYNATKWIDKCFSSLKKSSVPLDCIIIDNNSTDGTVSEIKNKYPEYIIVETGKNLGFGKANNVGLKYAMDNKYDYAYLLNQDAWIFPNTLKSLIAVQQKYTEYGILSPFQMQANMKNLDKNFADGVCCFKSNEHLISDLYLRNLDVVYDVPGVMAAHWLISRDCIKKVGGFSPSFKQYGEDDNYSDRAKYHGFKIGIVPSAKAVHDREFRKKNLKHDMYMNCYVSILRILNAPVKERLSRNFARWFFLSLYYTIFKLRLEPLRYSLKLLWSLPKIIKNRKISITNESAFI